MLIAPLLPGQFGGRAFHAQFRPDLAHALAVIGTPHIQFAEHEQIGVALAHAHHGDALFDDERAVG